MAEGAPQTGAVALDEEELIEDWPLRPWVLAALLGVGGLLIHLLTDIDDLWDEPAWRAAGTSFVWFGFLALAFSLNRKRAIEAGLFALVIGLIMGGIAWHMVSADDQHAATELSFASGVFFSLLALPLFQAGFHKTRFATDYRATHFHVWSDAISGAGALAFVGISWLLLHLLDALFQLVGIELIRDLTRESWFGWIWSGAVGGAALGVLRNNLKIIGALQRVVMLVFALLAVPFAAAIVIFLAVLIASGGQALWAATDDATPILLSCAAACFIFFNTIIRDTDEERSKSRIMQIAAAVLAACILPLTVFSAVSMGIRIDQYGLAPERIWALIAIAIATAYGLASFVALVRGRLAGWSQQLRQVCFNMAVVACGIAFLLALPLVDFGGVSARNQVDRLNAGKVTAEQFDFAALRFDFGASGEAVLAELAEGEGEVATLAAEAQEMDERPYERFGKQRNEADLDFRLITDNPQLRPLVVEFLLLESYVCREQCVILDLGQNRRGQRQIAVLTQHRYSPQPGYDTYAISKPTDGCETDCWQDRPKIELSDESKVAIEKFERSYITVDGEPIGQPLSEDAVDGLSAQIPQITQANTE